MLVWRDARNVLFLTAALLAGAFNVSSQAPPQAPVNVGLTPNPASASEAMHALETAVTAGKRTEHNILHRPIDLSDDNVHWVDRSYAYGSTQWGRRPVHLGVEFVNPRGTPIYAAKAGVVVYAGSDDALLFGPKLDYYGNVVVLAHQIRSLAGNRVFTLYGHLETITVATGQQVEDLDPLGRVGASGVAIGPHLHFEVRVDDPYDYRLTRNPELWLQHYIDCGMIIGALRDAAGNRVYGKRISVRSEDMARDVYTYGDESVNPDPIWDENFTVGDLPAGTYEIVVLDEAGAIAYQEQVAVEAYRTTFVRIDLSD